MGTSRRKPRQARSRETLDILLEAAAQVFSREGISATTNRIAERAGVSVGTLYQYFPDKHAMLRAVAGRHVRAAEDRLTEVFDRLRRDQPPFDDAMAEVLELVVELHRDRPGCMRCCTGSPPPPRTSRSWRPSRTGSSPRWPTTSSGVTAAARTPS